LTGQERPKVGAQGAISGGVQNWLLQIKLSEPKMGSREEPLSENAYYNNLFNTSLMMYHFVLVQT